MKISSISDVHIKKSGDEPFKLLEKFFAHKNTQNSDLIVLNGDIFDILIGGKSQYLKKYEPFFELIKSVVELGATIIYIEGNHDFHIQKLIKKSIRKFSIPSDKFIHVKNTYSVTLGNENILFTHGDEVELDNFNYRKYKSRVNNALTKFLGDYILPFSLIEWIGHKASSKSRKSNESKYEISEDGQNFVKDKFRKSADVFFELNNGVSLLVCGHSHCKDIYKKNGKTYINNGFALRSKTFIYISQKGPEFIEL